ncbi:hypothetical protein GCM10011371_34990 [Novosphingobium marinum]|uniref:Uncharacterized protein n=1 Tax=Novosphingobium marinum TaxID=1514948 RepID=A0A7Z0BWC7_9SPHN|nr:hypothetical protein [Novosphingobium marinum]NYH97203.1 hypothetical protein [Novosphingobium marinum]GGC44584.1 hypothetical protein GCM10011371_34990 [Novosphingobium marinum]
MKIFRIDNLEIDPLTIIAASNERASATFTERMVVALGFVPNASWEVVEWRPRGNGKFRSLYRLGQGFKEGLAFKGEDGWELASPLWDDRDA